MEITKEQFINAHSKSLALLTMENPKLWGLRELFATEIQLAGHILFEKKEEK